MPCSKCQKSVLNSKVKRLIKRSKIVTSKELQCFLESTEPLDWISNDGTPLLHLAVKHNHLQLMKLLLNNGYDVDAKNSSGDTPLLVALKLNNFTIAVNMLLDADADICVTDPSTDEIALQILLADTRYYHYFSRRHIMNNLKRRNIDIDTLIELLITVECPFEYVMIMNDIEISRKFLERNPTDVNDLAIDYAMEQRDFETVEMILRLDNQSGRSAFYKNLVSFLSNNEIERWQLFMERVYDWNFVSEEALEPFSRMFPEANMEQLQILLDSKFIIQLRQKFGVDLRTFAAGNEKVDVEILQYLDLKVHPETAMQHSALHYAIRKNFVEGVRFLINSGADVNIRDDRYRTPIFECVEFEYKHSHNNYNIDIGQVLLEYGADVQTIDRLGNSPFELAIDNCNDGLLELLIAQLAINYNQGVPIVDRIKGIINDEHLFKTIFETCCHQLQVLKTQEIVSSVTLFDLLTGKNETLCRSLRSQDIMPLIDQYRKQHGLHWLYHSTMKNKLIRISNLFRFKCDIANVISQSTGNLINSDHLVISEMSRYLTPKDINVFLKCSQ